MCDFDHTLHNIVAGRRRHVIQAIEQQTSTNIYLPCPWQGVERFALTSLESISPHASSSSRGNDALWITGDVRGVQTAKDMLQQLYLQTVSLQLLNFCVTTSHVA